MPRAIWKGAISFGLVNVPIEVFPAIRAAQTGFNLLDKRTLDPVGYRQINKRTGKEVSRQDIVRGYAYEKGKYAVLTDDEIAAASPESTQTVDIIAFIDAPQLSFLYLDTPYYLAPERRGAKAYALLRDALQKSGKIGIASVVLHSRQHLAALVPAGPVLALETLHWSDEVRSLDELGELPETAKASGVSARELEMAQRLIDDMSETWNPADYHDTFHDEILALVERKVREGKTSEVETIRESAAPRRSADILDLSDLLKRSLGRKPGGDGADADEDSTPRRGGVRRAKGSPRAVSGAGTSRKTTPRRSRHAA